MHADYLVFWYDGSYNQASVIRIEHPPLERLTGESLQELLIAELQAHENIDEPMINGAVELSKAVWSPGIHRTIITGDGRSGVVEAEAEGWKVRIAEFA